ncbi:MAG: hypothetical protein UV05_C0039G0001 [candidate division CPR1 bacterium GW2011_GWA2_42_17]|uniref:Uncharacterized protein n=1 Tax=candidate division CPR1 bacterium GW2011_GWA2_42_17 TaxID=1618341 RepID=A0A0G1B8J3_9BACT|nr:MAG: hypothetical protein UV05_C0039G0001 [candidate division CPR1 bacterium GW2011_GWA2_42_17]
MLRKGFTLIELLIVISILGILAVAVLSAINPVEQLKKSRDARRKSDVAELLNAHERYFTTFGCYVWDNYSGTCGNGNNPTASAVTATTFVSGSINGDLVTKEEIKTQFSTRQTVTLSEMFMTEDSTNNQLSICFSPESKSARAGGLGPLRTQTNAAAGSCGASYTVSAASCNVCVPQ